MEPVLVAVLVLVAVIIGVGGGFLVTRLLVKKSGVTASLAESEALRATELKAREILDAAQRDADRLLKEAELRAKEEALRRRDELTREMELLRGELRDTERRLEKREDAVEEKGKDAARKERHLEAVQKKLHERKDGLEKKQKALDAALEEQAKKLHELTGLSRDDAEKMLLDRIERELADEVQVRLVRHEEAIKLQADGKAREILASTVQRIAAAHTAGSTVSTVDIPSDDIKGRIIGREGRNIRTFEKATGVDVIVDDTPGVVIVSAFDNIRREIARVSLNKLIQDGRIHPTRIEEVVAETQAEMEQQILDTGRQAAMEVDIPLPHESILKLLGRLKYRTSYSQNVLRHSVEVAFLCGMLAGEMGLNPQLARRCGLLHDVGKAADHEMEGGHPKIGADLAKRYGETSKEVLHAIAGHHDDITVDHIYTVLVAAADAISASRPGARRETLEKYVKRLENLEAVACGFPEVDAAFAIQAGRELRVIANAGRTTDADAARVCREIAKAIEQQLDYPGEIKVTVIRETRAVETAK